MTFDSKLLASWLRQSILISYQQAAQVLIAMNYILLRDSLSASCCLYQTITSEVRTRQISWNRIWRRKEKRRKHSWRIAGIRTTTYQLHLICADRQYSHPAKDWDHKSEFLTNLFLSEHNKLLPVPSHHTWHALIDDMIIPIIIEKAGEASHESVLVSIQQVASCTESLPVMEKICT